MHADVIVTTELLEGSCFLMLKLLLIHMFVLTF